MLTLIKKVEELNTKQLKFKNMNYVFIILILLIACFTIWAVFVESKLKVGKKVDYISCGRFYSGVIEFIGTDYVSINGQQIPKKYVVL